MTREELLRILDFVESTNALGGEDGRLTERDSRWNVVIYTMRRHPMGQLLTIAALADASGAP